MDFGGGRGNGRDFDMEDVKEVGVAVRVVVYVLQLYVVGPPAAAHPAGEDWIFASPEYTDLYHQYFEDFLRTADPAGIIAEARALIAPYVERDPYQYPDELLEPTVEAFRRILLG